MSNSNTRPYAHFWVERSYGHYSYKEQLERSEKENEKLREACKAALDYLQLPELTWKENLIDILTEFLTCCKD